MTLRVAERTKPAAMPSGSAHVRHGLPRKKCACSRASASGGDCAECRHARAAMHIPDSVLGHSFEHVSVHTDKRREPAPAQRNKKIAGLDVTKSHCSCLSDMPDLIKFAQLQVKLYGDCGKDAKNKTAADIETCNDAELAKRGYATTVAGTTSESGAVSVTKSPGACGPIRDQGTEVHEAVHKGYQHALEKAVGKGTKAFASHWDNPKEWATDEVNAYTAEIAFYQTVVAYLQSICGPFSGTGALGGALIGGLAGVALGYAVGGPIGALVGGLIGGVGGLLVGGFLGGRE